MRELIKITSDQQFLAANARNSEAVLLDIVIEKVNELIDVVNELQEIIYKNTKIFINDEEEDYL